MEHRKFEKQVSVHMPPLAWVAITAAVLILGFFAGVAYLKGSHNTADDTPAAQGAMGGPSPSGSGGKCGPGPKAVLMINGQQIESCGRPATGSVTNISDSSITVDAQNGSQTFSIGSDTKISKDGGPAAVSDIATGDRVAIISSDGSSASYVIVNPQVQEGP
jgi:hypothetical protein